MTLLADGQIIRTYRIALGGNPEGPKERQGDKKTPEGIYYIKGRNKSSRFYLSLHISYPNEDDIRRAKKMGVSPGGNIMIHGLKNDFSWMGEAHTQNDWTEGCIAVTNEEIEEIDKLVPNGTIVKSSLMRAPLAASGNCFSLRRDISHQKQTFGSLFPNYILRTCQPPCFRIPD